MDDNNWQGCSWAQGELYQRYHDMEWGVACHDGQRLFEKICLEGQQAGLSWITVLKKREHYRQCFFDFDATKIAAMTDEDIEVLLEDTGLIRNRLKLFAIRKNAQAFLKMQASGQAFTDFIWQFVENEIIVNHYESMSEIPAQTEASQAMSKALKKSGFTFVGATICYAFMQSMGLVNDHLLSCPQHPDYSHESS
ncbi:MAG: DNA-3-methyladenine glycosylase I [Pseudomonadales bacterium]|nr:DNA-3-methyladenine glycosylase I [Pseudomonadales bacterium]